MATSSSCQICETPWTLKRFAWEGRVKWTKFSTQPKASPPRGALVGVVTPREVLSHPVKNRARGYSSISHHTESGTFNAVRRDSCVFEESRDSGFGCYLARSRIFTLEYPFRQDMPIRFAPYQQTELLRFPSIPPPKTFEVHKIK